MTEPEAGSDVAAVQTRARPVDGGWVIDGQKMFTTNGHVTDYVFLLARTDPTASATGASPRSSCRSTAPASRPRPCTRCRASARTSPTTARCSSTTAGASARSAPGWHSLMLALQDEHSAPFSPHLARLLDGGRARGRRAPGPTAPPRSTATTCGSAWSGRPPTSRWPSCSRRARRGWRRRRGARGRGADEQAVQHRGAGAAGRGPHRAGRARRPAQPGATRPRCDGGRIEHALRFSLGTTIYAGTSEVQRNIIAQRRCGLPRS